MFQKSLLKNFVKSFNTPNSNDVIKLITKDKFIAEDANGAEFITLLSKIFFDFNIKSIDGNNLELSTYKNKAILLVNVASNCGFIKQY